MPAGDGWGPAERYAIDEAIRKAEQTSGMRFSVFVGRAQGATRAFALSLHGQLVEPERSILVMVDPAARALEIVSGAVVRRSLHDTEAELAAAQMQSSLANGDSLVDALRRGLAMLAEHARPPQMLHVGP